MILLLLDMLRFHFPLATSSDDPACFWMTSALNCEPIDPILNISEPYDTLLLMIHDLKPGPWASFEDWEPAETYNQHIFGKYV